jgi:hypothetical protein
LPFANRITSASPTIHAFLPELDIERGCLAGLLGEDMQHIDGVLELCHLEDALLALGMDSNLDDSGTDDWNRPPIAGRTSRLNQAQLIADVATRSLREPPQAVTTVSEPLDRPCATPHALRLYRIFIAERNAMGPAANYFVPVLERELGPEAPRVKDARQRLASLAAR